MKLDRDSWYIALKKADSIAYKKAIEYAEAYSITHNLNLNEAAELEWITVSLTCELLQIRV